VGQVILSRCFMSNDIAQLFYENFGTTFLFSFFLLDKNNREKKREKESQNIMKV